MMIRWLLQVCIVLGVGMGLASCTKAEIEQAMNRPAEIMLQSSPCQPAGIASTATPEFCINVMEIQLLRQDTQADVSLTLVNRTGNRQYIILSREDLKDSSGTRWNPARSSGLGRGGPLPVEPTIEAQGTLSFFQSGQATTGLTFSLRGEIAIYRVDSRGQPINATPYAVQRGFTLSGIRIPQQPPQSSAPTEQKPDTKLAQGSPRSVAPSTPKASASSQSTAPEAVVGASGSGNSSSQKPASSNASSTSDQMAKAMDTPAGDAVTSKNGSKSVGSSGPGPDVIGLRVGTTPKEMRAIITSRNLVAAGNRDNYFDLKNTLSYFYAGKLSKVPNGEYLSEVHINGKEGKFQINFSHVPGNEEILTLYREMSFEENKRPTYDALEKALVEKYGAPTYGDPSSLFYHWAYDKDGTVRKPGAKLGLGPGTGRGIGDCGITGRGTMDFADMETRPFSLKDYTAGCGAIHLIVRIDHAPGSGDGGNAIVNGYATTFVGYDAAARTVKASKAIVDKALAAESGVKIKEAEQQKPNL